MAATVTRVSTFGARSTIIFKPGKIAVCGFIYTARSPSRLVVMPDEKPVLRW
jgi:hypothetical protein